MRIKSPSRVMPALLISTSTGPWCSSTSAKARSMSSTFVTSHWTPNRPSGAPLLRWVTATESPCAAKERAIASPIPRLPPVTSTDLPTCHSPAPGCLPEENLAGGRGTHLRAWAPGGEDGAMSRIAILPPGRRGAALGAALIETGHDVGWLPAGRSAGSRRRAEEAGLTALDDLTDRDLVLSVCPP